MSGEFNGGAPVMYPDGSMLWLGQDEDAVRVQIGTPQADGGITAVGCRISAEHARALGKALIAMGTPVVPLDAPGWYSTTEAGHLLGMSRRRVIEQIELGQLEATRSSRNGWWRVSAEAITAWQKRHSSSQRQRVAAALRSVS